MVGWLGWRKGQGSWGSSPAAVCSRCRRWCMVHDTPWGSAPSMCTISCTSSWCWCSVLWNYLAPDLVQGITKVPSFLLVQKAGLASAGSTHHVWSLVLGRGGTMVHRRAPLCTSLYTMVHQPLLSYNPLPGVIYLDCDGDGCTGRAMV